jgi:hypothetical protein
MYDEDGNILTDGRWMSEDEIWEQMSFDEEDSLSEELADSSGCPFTGNWGAGDWSPPFKTELVGKQEMEVFREQNMEYKARERYMIDSIAKKGNKNACQCGELGTKRCNAQHCHASVCEKDECGRDHCFSQESRGETFWCDACHKKNDSAPSCDYCSATEMEDSDYSLVKCSKRGCKKHVPSNPGDGCCEAGYNEHYFCGECENRYCKEHAVKCCN